jgi:subtilisin family serine protease
MMQVMAHARAGLAVAAAVALGLVTPAQAIERSRLPVEVVPVQQISGETLSLPGRSPLDTLKAVPAIGLNPPVSARDTQVLIDGVRLPPEAGLALPADRIERVEVLKEGAGVLYGQDGTAGVINIVTREGTVAVPDAPGDGGAAELGARVAGALDGAVLAAEYTDGCSVSAGQSRPFWSYTGGAAFGGPLLRDYTWYVPADGAPAAPAAGWTMVEPAAGTAGGFRPYVFLGGAPGAAAGATGSPAAAPSAPAPPSAFPAGAFRGGIPSEGTVLNSPACPEELKARLKGLYQQRYQAMADMVYYNDFRAPPSQRDPARVDEARARRDKANQEIRALLDQCPWPESTPPATTATSAGPATAPTSPPAPTAAPPLLGLGFAPPARGSAGQAPRGELGWDLSLRADYALPWAGAKDAETDAGLGAIRGFGPAGKPIEIRLTWPLASQIGMTSLDYNYLADAVRNDAFATPAVNPNPWLTVVPDDARLQLYLPLQVIDSQIVEVGGTRPDVRVGTDDSRDRFLPTIDTEGKIPPPAVRYFREAFNIGGKTYFVFTYPDGTPVNDASFRAVRGATATYEDSCAEAALPVPVSDPAHRQAGGGGSWGQGYPDQWAVQRVGYTGAADSAWAAVPADAPPVVIGVIDTGLDWHHQDFDWNNLWKNEDEIPDNGRDDDRNGYVDDVFGWDFTADSNRPWDYDGHGTFVTGIIAATRDNGAGIAGINPGAKIMVLKALNTFGRTRASYVARAIAYGVDNGARILNLSLAGKGLPPVVQEAMRYAESKGVLVVVAAGNTGEDLSGFHPAGYAAGMTGAMAIAATDPDDRRPAFSNWGAGISLAAPGVDVMSLRARRTDFNWNTGDTSQYRPGANILGTDRRYYRATGTSFAAPIVTATASLVWARNPALSAADVRRILEQSARDIEAPGVDQFTGYGLLDAKAALAADPAFYVEAAITGVTPEQRGNDVILVVNGTAAADRFASARLEYGAGEAPATFTAASRELRAPVRGGVVGEISARDLAGSGTWTLRLVTRHDGGREREARFLLQLN